MKIGNYEIHAIESGRFALDGGAMFGVVPKTLWEKTNPSDDKNRIDLALRNLLIIGEGKRILVDTGMGTKWQHKFIDIYKLDHTKYNLINSLKQFNLEPKDITDVILTHLHFDHAGGATIFEDEKLKSSFPNAMYYVQRKNWEWANNPSEKDRASYLKENFIPLFENDQLKLIDGEFEFSKGITNIISDGHTTALQLTKISDGNTTLVYCADLIPTASHIPIPWVMSYDLRPLETMEEKKKILEQAEKENWIIFFEHDPFREASFVVKDEKGFRKGEDIRL
jgi:glyoxylase-like metal-dependent hydrolase (beta-lactamase superfamily II)